MDTKILEKIGMTEGEVRVYLALLELGNSSTGPIIEKSHITSSKVYIILERLEKKGLVSHVIENNVKKFQVADPNRLLEYMDEKEEEIKKDTEEIKKIIPELKSKQDSKETQETTMYFGFKGFQTAIKELISDLEKGDEYVVFGAQGHFGEAFENFIRNFYKDKEERGIKTRLIYNSDFKEIKKLYSNLKLTKIRFIDHLTPSTIAISKTKILLNAYGDNPIQVLIKSETLARSFYEFFESMWEISK